jgi:hypothetical protein
VAIQETAVTWLSEQDGSRVYAVQWSGVTATLDVTTDDGSVPPLEDLKQALATAIPSFVGVLLDVGQGVEHRVQ